MHGIHVAIRFRILPSHLISKKMNIKVHNIVYFLAVLRTYLFLTLKTEAKSVREQGVREKKGSNRKMQ